MCASLGNARAFRHETVQAIGKEAKVVEDSYGSPKSAKKVPITKSPLFLSKKSKVG